MTQLAELETAPSPTRRRDGELEDDAVCPRLCGSVPARSARLRRELLPFVIRVCMNPLLFLFVFTFIMPHMSGGAAMNPTAAMAGMQLQHCTASGTDGGRDHVQRHRCCRASACAGVRHHARDRRPRHVSSACSCRRHREDLLLRRCRASSPLLSSSPCVLHSRRRQSWHTSAAGHFFIVVLVLASLTSGALGLTIGTSVKPQQIGLIFGVVVMPITFLGCVYYPWAAAG